MSGRPVELRTPADLQRVMRADYALSDQQWEIVTAPTKPKRLNSPIKQKVSSLKSLISLPLKMSA